MLKKTRNNVLQLIIVGLGCLAVSQAVVQCTPKNPPPAKASDVPNNVAAIDSAIKSLEYEKARLQGQEYSEDDDAMQHEFQSWMDYQGDLDDEAATSARLKQVEQEISELKARKAKLLD